MKVNAQVKFKGKTIPIKIDIDIDKLYLNSIQDYQVVQEWIELVLIHFQGKKISYSGDMELNIDPIVLSGAFISELSGIIIDYNNKSPNTNFSISYDILK